MDKPPKTTRAALQMGSCREVVDCARCGAKARPGGKVVEHEVWGSEQPLETEWLGKKICEACFIAFVLPQPGQPKLVDGKSPTFEAPLKKFKPLQDSDPFPFGTHKGRRMEDVPAQFLDWLHGQSWLVNWPAVEDYVKRCRKHIDVELKKGKG